MEALLRSHRLPSRLTPPSPSPSLLLHHCPWMPSLPLHRSHLRGASFLARAEETPQSEASRSSVEDAPSGSPKIPDGKGTGFGGSTAVDSARNKKKKKGGGREKGSVIRRSPLDESSLVYSASKQAELRDKQSIANENSFLLIWLALGALILVEGIALAASGFLPEEWDGFFVKFLYPSFTPTVLLFLVGTVGYGVFKYLQAEKLKS